MSDVADDDIPVTPAPTPTPAEIELMAELNKENYATEEMMDDIQDVEESTLEEGGGEDILTQFDDDAMEYSKSRGVFGKVYDGIATDKIFADKQINDDRIKFKTVAVPPGKGMPSPISFDELGEVMGFTIGVSDKLMVLNVEYEDTYGKLNVISDSSAYELAQIGRGMTIGEAESQFPTTGFTSGLVSRDISGYNSGTFVFVSRYDDSLKNNSTDAEAAGNADLDRWFVLNYEPKPYTRYTKFKLDVLNVSAATKYVHYFEIKRRVYHDLSDVNVDKDITDILTGEVIRDQPTNYVKGEEELRTDAILDDVYSDANPVYQDPGQIGDDADVMLQEVPINPNTGEPLAEVLFTSNGPVRRKRAPSTLEIWD